MIVIFTFYYFLIAYNIKMLELLDKYEQKLRIWRGIVLLLTIIMLLMSIFSKDNWAVLSLIIAFFALVLFQMATLPHSTYQVFMVLLLVNLIIQAGLFLNGVTEQNQHDAFFFIRHSYNLLTIMLFMLVLWRHYQKDQLRFRLDPQVEEQM